MPTKKQSPTAGGTDKPAKKSVKKTTATKIAKPVATEVVETRYTDKTVVKEVFQSAPSIPAKVEVAPNSVILFVNGREKGAIDTTEKTLGAFAQEQAQHNGIRTFSLYVDGVKADTRDSSKLMSEYTKVEIVSKDTRGKNAWTSYPTTR